MRGAGPIGANMSIIAPERGTVKVSRIHGVRIPLVTPLVPGLAYATPSRAVMSSFNFACHLRLA